MAASEGVTKFEATHTSATLSSRVHGDLACELIAWREIMAMTALVGRDPARYDGAAYGNVSARTGPPSAARGRRRMLITGTQTGDRRALSLADFCLVTRYDIARNRVESTGSIAPSSEAMTHGAVYDCSPAIRFVLHAHSPVIWQAAQDLRIATTAPEIAYGTPEMAAEVSRLYRHGSISETRLFAMGGHRDGIVVFGKSADEAGVTLLTALAAAYRRQCEIGPSR